MLYDIIPDIHGDIDRLHETLRALGWRSVLGRWQGPEDRSLAFLGDFIDGGDCDAEVLHCLWTLVEQGAAVAVMGNHELNALHYHRRDETGDWMREHSRENARQHAAFLARHGAGTPQALSATRRFLDLPLWLDLGDLRIVHACWDDDAIATIAARRPDGRLREEDLEEVALDETEFAQAVNQTLKGPKRALPCDARFADHSGHLRRKARIKWWTKPARTWRDAVVSVPDLDQIPAVPITGEDRLPFYDPAAKPVIFGHYKLDPEMRAGSHNTLCLDYPARAMMFRQSRSTEHDIRSGLVAA